MKKHASLSIAKTAIVAKSAQIGKGSLIWNSVQLRENTRIGSNCLIGSGVYIDKNVQIGDRVKIENNAQIFHGAQVENEVFIGPGVILTNDRFPRSTSAGSGRLKNDQEWTEEQIHLKQGASVGALSVILPGITVGEYAFVGAGSVVTHDVGRQELVYGNPARIHGFVCLCGKQLTLAKKSKQTVKCRYCHQVSTFEQGKIRI